MKQSFLVSPLVRVLVLVIVFGTADSLVVADEPRAHVSANVQIVVNNHPFGDTNGSSVDLGRSGKLTCGHPGHVSDVAWTLLSSSPNGDVSRTSRASPSDLDNSATDHKEITYAGVPLLAWRDDHQKISLRPNSDQKETAAGLARTLLDDSKAREQREAIIGDHPELAAALIAAMVADLPKDAKEEYRRIPWIWRVAIASGKRNDAEELRRLLAVSLPADEAPLDDWRAVVLGGGLINGISQAGDWPGERLEHVLQGHPELEARWRRSVDLAAVMADDDRVRSGTRYDALRMLGAEPWDRRGAQLFRYLLKGVHPELQQGAVSALADVRSPCTGQALLSGLPHYSVANRAFALDALLRDDGRTSALLDALADSRLRRDDLGADRIKRLLQHPDEALQRRAIALLGD
ncbi:MAG: hypothetical protein ABI353_06470 [Isosphaeraceae bacterium]